MRLARKLSSRDKRDDTTHKKGKDQAGIIKGTSEESRESKFN